MNHSPINPGIIEGLIKEMEIKDFSKATIREVKAIASEAEKQSNIEFIKMEMGVPGLPPSKVGVEAEIEALRKGVAQFYPDINGIPKLKEEASKFAKNFINADVSPKGCIAVTGSMQGTYASFMTCSQCDAEKDTVLFIDPGFPVQKQQLRVMGVKHETFDAYHYRGDNLKAKLESYLAKGNICAIIYSNPNNPSWVCLKEEELQVIGELATKYDTTVLEDLAYFAMDFRTDLSKPGVPPYQPSVSKYTNNYILLISGSKAFSYAGQRIGVCCISDYLFNKKFKGLEDRYGVGTFGIVFPQRVLYALSSGVSHSAQYALAGMFEAANKGEYNFLEEVKEYGRRAKLLKEIFVRNGFHIVYDKDMESPIADGFYFTIGYKNMTSGELSKALLFYGVSAISLRNTGSEQQGVRICTSFIKEHQYDDLEKRMKLFAKDN